MVVKRCGKAVDVFRMVRALCPAISLVLALACTGPNPAFMVRGDGLDSGGDAALDGPGARPGLPDAADAAAIADAAPMADRGVTSDAWDAPVLTPPPVVKGLLGYWSLDDGSGTVVRDHSGQNRHGELLGASLGVTWDAQGAVAGGLRFPGGRSPDVGVRIPADATIENLKRFTVAAHVKVRALSPSGTHLSVISRQVGATDREAFNITCNSDDVIAYVPGTGSQVNFEARADMQGRAGVFQHVAATYDGMELVLYVDGAEKARQSFAGRLETPVPSNPIYIGTNKNSAHSEPFDGIIDEVVLYDHALGPTAIQQLAMGRTPFEVR